MRGRHLFVTTLLALASTPAHALLRARINSIVQSRVVASPAIKSRVLLSPVAIAPLPSVGVLATASVVPTLLGFWKTEYGVSYAYGSAMAAIGTLVLPAASSPLARAHALALVLYGVRLNAFLLYREIFIPRFQKFREKIEERTKAKGNRLSRTPFVLGCSFLYYCMGAPLLLTATAAPPTSALLKVETALMYLGFLIAALGDLQKSIVKATKGEDALVTNGIYKFLRHPNYTGELLLWGASFAAAVTVAPAILAAATMSKLAVAGWLLASATGYAGIAFVLIQAATGLEKKQKDKYGAGEGKGGGPYERWVATSWAGPTK